MQYGELRYGGELRPVIQVDWHDKSLILQPNQVIEFDKLDGFATVEAVEVDALIVRTGERVQPAQLLIERTHNDAGAKATIQNLANEPIYVGRIKVVGRRS
jgi:hypothetical protein